MLKKIGIFFKLLKRIFIHKFWVAYYCFQIGLYWQGIVHDLSKFSYIELSRGIKYWDDEISSLASERKLLGYSKTFLHHRGRNPHHYEYWIHSLDLGGVPCAMPRKYMLELICDYLAACKTYKNDPKSECKWWNDNCESMKIHAYTKNYISIVFREFQKSSLRESIKYADKVFLKS